MDDPLRVGLLNQSVAPQQRRNNERTRDQSERLLWVWTRAARPLVLGDFDATSRLCGSNERGGRRPSQGRPTHCICRARRGPL